MNKDFLIGFLCCLSLLTLIGATSQINNTFNDPQSLNDEFTNVYKELNAHKFTIMVSTPSPSQLNEGQAVWVGTGPVSLFGRVNGSTYSVTLAKQ